MKKFISVILTTLAFVVLVGCNDGEVGNGKNQQPTEKQQALIRDPANAEQIYGKVLYDGTVAPTNRVMVTGQDITKDLTLISILTKGNKAKPGTAFLLACDLRGGTWSLASNIYTPEGQPTDKALDIAIMNFPDGLTEIREVDDSKRPYFSTAEGDSDIVSALKGLGKLDPESTIVFVAEETKDDGYRYSVGWSPMLKVKDVVAGLKNVDLSSCAKTTMDEDYYNFLPNETLMGK